MAETSNRNDVDWDGLSDPVPLNLIEPGFPVPEESERQPGARSEILTREESEAVANMPHATDPDTMNAPDSEDEPTAATLEMTIRMPAVRSGTIAPPDADAVSLADAGPKAESASPEPNSLSTADANTFDSAAAATIPYDTAATVSFFDDAPTFDAAGAGATGAGADTKAIVFASLRAEMEAQAEAEKASALLAEQEEASQQERLQQWMANAQARLLKADADLTGPEGNVHQRRERSPSLNRLAEMQKTMLVDASAGSVPTLAETPEARARLAEERRLAEAPSMPVDPMATIMVTKEQFLGLKAAPDPATASPSAEAGAPKPEGLFKTGAIINLASLSPDDPVRSPHAPLRDGSPTASSPFGGFPNHPGSMPGKRTTRMSVHGDLSLTREEALTRKIALLRDAAEGPDKDVLAMMDDSSSRNSLHLALAALMLLVILILGVCLFAATQSGMFDGLEDRYTFLRPNVSAQLSVHERESEQTPAAAVAPRKPIATPAPDAPAPARPAARPVKRPAAGPTSPAVANAQAAPAARDSRPGPDASTRSERIIRSSLQSLAHIDVANLQELYNRYALGFPGLSGEVVMGLTVRPDGSILEGSVVSSTTGVEAFNQELLRRVLEWRLRSIPETAPKFITFTLLFPLQGH